MTSIKASPTWRSRLGLSILLLITLIVDQWTKYLARMNFGFPGGEPDYFKVKHVIGEWLQFRLIYNTGAAFGMKPQQFLPFLNPTLFYVLFSTVAIGFLTILYRKLPREDLWQKAGITLILSGAFGNLIDRLRFQKVTDFIDVGIPGMPTRWPTFNIADSCVCVGVAMILLSSWMPRKRAPQAAGETPETNP
ncbi:MAG: lipoprotein signal peptidase [Fibrobacteres bacterium]|nr:lipoprotein signal peptidase [Fibrobacterota bacterium]